MKITSCITHFLKTSSVPLQVFFELDLTSPRTLSQLSQCQLLPPGQHISEVIPTDLYLRLRMHLDYVRRAMPGWLTRDQLDSGLLAEHLFPTLTGRSVFEYSFRSQAILFYSPFSKLGKKASNMDSIDGQLSHQERHRIQRIPST